MQNPQNPQSEQLQNPQNVQQPTRPRYQYDFTEAQMKHSFYKLGSMYLWLLVLGGLITAFGIMLNSNYFTQQLATFFIVSGIGLLICGGIIYGIYADRPTDELYERWVTERSQVLYKIALQRLHLHESQCESIIEVQGGISSLLQLTKKFPEKEIVVKRLSNGLRHYSINVAMYVFLTKDDIAIYSGYINALAQQERFEDADHYYYKNIVAVSTSGPIYTFGANMVQRQGFLVRASNGDVVGTDYATKVILRQGENRVETKGVDNVVAALLQLLRDHQVSSIEASKISGETL